jgi:hypothetical protein
MHAKGEMYASEGLISAVRERETMRIGDGEKVVTLPEEKFCEEWREMIRCHKLIIWDIDRIGKTDWVERKSIIQKVVMHVRKLYHMRLMRVVMSGRRGGGYRNLMRGWGGGVGSWRSSSGDLV